MSLIEHEQPITFSAAGDSLLGIWHPPAHDAPTRALVVVVGGPQYRVGSHRQFVLLARAVAASGVAVFRFDYRGMGDSGGGLRDFADIGQDISAAIDAVQARCPSVARVALWGLCDAASAAAFYGWRDPRVSGLTLLNPWIRTVAGEARTVLRHYYLRRLMSGDFWRKLLRGGVSLGRSLGDIRDLQARARIDEEVAGLDLPGRMLHGLSRFDGKVMVILSGNDLVAQEFLDHVAARDDWQAWLGGPAVVRHDLNEADHTFSRRRWRDQVSEWTCEWLKET